MSTSFGAGTVSGVPAAQSDPRLRGQVALWLVIAPIVAAGVVWDGLQTAGGPAPDWWLVGLLLGAVVASGVTHVRVSLRGSVEATTLNEIGIVPLMVLLPSQWAVAVGFVGCLVAEVLLTRAQLQKLLFNVAWQTAAIASGSWLYQVVVGTQEPFAASARPLVAALLAGVVFVTVNLIAIAGVFAVTSDRSWLETLTDEVPSSLVLNVGTAVTGVLVAVLVVAAPLALPLLVVPVLLNQGRARTRSEGLEQVAAERDRFERTVAGSSDGVVLLDATGRVEVWNPAMVALTGHDEKSAIGATLDELGLARLARPKGTPAGGEHRIDMDGRVIEVRRADLGHAGRAAARLGGSVLSIRDVSREAELARIRDDLVARISHELRTPLTTVEGFLETLELRWDELTDEQRYAMVTTGRRGAHRLGRLVANLVTWDRIGPGADVAETASHEFDTAVGPVVKRLVDDMELPQPVVVDLGVGAHAQIAPGDLQIVVSNLLSNAALYGAPPVEVGVRTADTTVLITVTDHGPGLPAEFRPHLFQPFRQATGGLRRTSQGLGIGLMVVRSLVTAAGGTVTHEGPQGGGARFEVALPAAPRPPR